MSKLIRFSLATLVFIFLGAVVAFWYGSKLLEPVSVEGVPTTTFEIPKGQAASVIAQRLSNEGFIRHPLVFRWELQKENLTNRLQAGVFELSPSMSVSEIIQELIVGTNDTFVTIPEGWRHEEIADFLDDQQDLPNFDKKEFLVLSDPSEGKLFPAKYDISKDATAEDVYTLLTSTFDKKIMTDMAEDINQSNYDFDEILIMASIIEREAKLNDKKIVSGILWNRIEIGMPLQVDATLQYVKGYNSRTNSWWSPPTAADKSLNSPFNTYQNAGLPPRPIANPGQKAIEAAIYPTASNDLFYIHDNQGMIHTAATLEEHNRNIDRYLR